MSLTTDIAALIGSTTALQNTFDVKATAIDAAVAAAMAAVPLQTRIVYLDQINGSDANDGLTAEKAVASFTRAIALGGAGRALDILLMSDYTFMQPRHTLAVNQMVRLRSSNAAVKRKVYLGLHVRTDSEISGDWEVGGFYAPSYGINTLNINSCEIVFPGAPGAGTMVSDEYNGILGSNVFTGPALIGFEINQSTLTRPAGSVGVVAGIRTHFLGLFVKGSTFVTADMAGKWVAGVASGAAPSSVGWVASNLTTL